MEVESYTQGSGGELGMSPRHRWTALTLIAAAAIFRQTRWAWPAAGICIALGILAKHTMVLYVPSFALFLCTTPTLRSQFARPGLWVMIGIGALGAVPIVAWNAFNGWVMFQHT